MIPRSSSIALICAILIHMVILLTIDFFLSPQSPPPRKMIPITYIGAPKQKKPEPMPEAPDMLAEINQQARAEQEDDKAQMATDPDANLEPIPETEPRPEPVTNPLPELIPAPLPEPPKRPLSEKLQAPPSIPQPAPRHHHNRATPDQELLANLRAKAKPEPSKLSKPSPVPSVTGRNQLPEPAITPPLMLSPSLDSLTRWDNQQQERKARQRSREATVNLNTQKVRYASYFAHVKNKMEQSWVYPAQARRKRISGSLTLAFTIGADGRLMDVVILRSSGRPILDREAFRALRSSAPFPPLPKSWGLDKLHTTTTFEYIAQGFRWKR